MERRRKKVGMKDSNNESISKPLLITQPFSISLFNKLLFQLGSWKCSCFLLHLLQHQHRRKNQAIKICSIRKICEEKYTYKTKVSEGTFLAGVDSNGLHEISPWGEYTVHTFRGLRATAQISETCFIWNMIVMCQCGRFGPPSNSLHISIQGPRMVHHSCIHMLRMIVNRHSHKCSNPPFSFFITCHYFLRPCWINENENGK